MASSPGIVDSNPLQALQAGAKCFIKGDRGRIRLYGFTCIFLVCISVGLFIYLIRAQAFGAAYTTAGLANLLTFLGSGVPLLPMMTLRNRVAALEALVAMASITPPGSDDAYQLKKKFDKVLDIGLQGEAGFEQKREDARPKR